MKSVVPPQGATRLARPQLAPSMWVTCLLVTVGCEEAEPEPAPPAPTMVERPCESAPPLVDGLPGRAGDLCVDERVDVRRYGSGTAGPLDMVCGELFHGDCDRYRSYGLEGVKTLRYVEASGAPHSVNVVLTRFRESTGAFGFFTARVVGDAPPSQLTMQPLDVAGRAALGSGTAVLWRGKQVVELTYVSEDETPDEIQRKSDGVLVPFVRALSEALPGPRDPSLDVRLLESMKPLPLALAHHVDGALGVVGSGNFSLAHFEGQRSHRLLVALRRDQEGAEDFLRLLRRQLRGHTFKYQPVVELQVASEQHAPEVWFASQLGRLVLAVGPPRSAPVRAKTKEQREAEEAAWRAFAVRRLLRFRKEASVTLAAE